MAKKWYSLYSPMRYAACLSIAGRPRPEVTGDSVFHLGLFPYASSDCLIIHLMMARKLHGRTVGGQAQTILSRVCSLEERHHIQIASPPRGRLTYAQKVDALIDLVDGVPEIARGAVDQYARSCRVEEFFSESEFLAPLWNQIVMDLHYAHTMSRDLDAAVLPDSAYTFSRALRHFLVSDGKPVFYLDAHGAFYDVSEPANQWLGRPSVSGISDLLRTGEGQSQQGSQLRSWAQRYCVERFAGQGLLDWDARLAYNNAKATEVRQWEGRRVLFLHCSRDAGFEAIRPRPFHQFRDHFEWMDRALQVVGKYPNQWFVKRHPSEDLYQGQREITDRLLDKHQVPDEIVQTQLTTSDVLRYRMRPFTFSGTIALEAAAYGYRGVWSNTYLPEALAIRALDPDKIEDIYMATTPSAAQELTQNEQELAQLLLYMTFAGNPANELRAEHPVLPSHSRMRFIASEVRAGMELAWHLRRGLGGGAADQVADLIHARLSAAAEALSHED